jgi:hypothetical protein
VVDEEDAKSIMLNRLPSKYNLKQLSSQILIDMIVALFTEENRSTMGDIEGDTQPKMTFYSRNNRNISTKGKREIWVIRQLIVKSMSVIFSKGSLKNKQI